MPRPRLFGAERAARGPRSTCTDLVPLARQACYECGGPVHRESIGQLALFRHGGYGATQETTFELCDTPTCRRVRVALVIEVSPRSLRYQIA